MLKEIESLYEIRDQNHLMFFPAYPDLLKELLSQVKAYNPRKLFYLKSTTSRLSKTSPEIMLDGQNVGDGSPYSSDGHDGFGEKWKNS